MLVSGITFILLGLAFGTTGMFNNFRLRTFFPDFYDEHLHMLWFASFGLTLPIIIRGVLDITRYSNKRFIEIVNENIAVYDTGLFLVCDLIPISFQFSSLIFGYIRRKQNRKL